METEFLLNEPNSPRLRLRRSLWTGRTKLYVDEQEVPREPKKGLFDQVHAFAVPMPDGTQRQLTLKNRIYDPVPEAHVDGQELVLAKPLQSWEYIVACVPIVLIFAGGALGAVAGLVATFTNMGIMRSSRPIALRIALCLGSTLAAFVVYMALGLLLTLALKS